MILMVVPDGSHPLPQIKYQWLHGSHDDPKKPHIFTYKASKGKKRKKNAPPPVKLECPIIFPNLHRNTISDVSTS